MVRSLVRVRPLLAAALGLVLAITAAADPAHWAGEIDVLTRDDAAHPPPSRGIVFVGSSSIRFWDSLAADFPGRPVIRRGFGGSELADSVYYFDRIVLPYHPATVVVYAGDNDIAAGKSPETVANDFRALVARTHATLPDTRVLFIAMKPSPSRWHLHEQYERGNRLIADQCAADPLLAFVDVWSAMLDAKGQPRPELFRPDMLHMKPAGYAIWVRLLTPLLPP
ncbi:MAG TPA: SGNH/GDSL hydrolase family protein [Lacunisphaera sp.]|nr:SGNH/GDSL hydrolase family protein [Lacunisphaera sp.]